MDILIIPNLNGTVKFIRNGELVDPVFVLNLLASGEAIVLSEQEIAVERLTDDFDSPAKHDIKRQTWRITPKNRG